MLADPLIYGQHAVGCYAGWIAGTVLAPSTLIRALPWRQGFVEIAEIIVGPVRKQAFF
ncbi:hypothetical protein PSCICO_01190 [Pseudomonas cichorii]|nr:hypothetical protein PSCICO_01190 [Pseudomonas cichorii]